MLMDILATDNMASYNVKIAQVMGLHTAIYINELINISAKAARKDKLVADKFFVLDRKYITRRTTIDEKEQLAIDYKLCKNDIIMKPEGSFDTLFLNIDKLAAIISSDDEKYLQKVSKNTKVVTTALPGMKLTMKQKQAAEMKTYITTTNDELKQSFEDWIDSVLANPKSSGLTKTKVNLFQRDVHTFANGNLDVALKVIELAIKGGYVDAQWAINNFNRDYSDAFRKRFVDTSSSGVGRKVSLDSEVF
jgi:hypothetical protein